MPSYSAKSLDSGLIICQILIGACRSYEDAVTIAQEAVRKGFKSIKSMIFLGEGFGGEGPSTLLVSTQAIWLLVHQWVYSDLRVLTDFL